MYDSFDRIESYLMDLVSKKGLIIFGRKMRYYDHCVLEAAAATGLRLLSEENGWSMHAMSFNPGHVH